MMRKKISPPVLLKTFSGVVKTSRHIKSDLVKVSHDILNDKLCVFRMI